MNCCRFIKKYKLSESTFLRYKHKLEKEYDIEIKCSYYKKPGTELSEEQEQDILNGMRPIDYMIKYDVAEDTFYSHRKRVREKYPDRKIETKYIKENRTLDVESISIDIKNGMTARDFCKKYVVGESCYRRYKRKILKDTKRPIPACITKEMQADLKSGIKCSDYCKKYSLSKDTYYNHKYALNIPKEQKRR